MTSPLRRAEEQLVTEIRQRGEAITITGSFGTLTPNALIGETRTQQQSPGRQAGIDTIARTQDFLVVTEDLDGRDVTRGLTITFAGLIFRPVAPNGEPVSRMAGRFGLVTRIHTVQVK